jgi:hypothetical protein
LPHIVNLQFLNKNADYLQGSQQALRMSTRSQQKTAIGVTVVLDDNAARTIAETLLYNAWTERTRFSFSLGRKYAYLEPTDILTLIDSEDAHTYVLRIVRKTDSRNGSAEYECVAEFSPIYQQRNVSTPSLVPTVPNVVSTPTVALVVETPTSSGILVGGGGTSGQWGGGSVWVSVDDGITYTQVGALTQQAIVGTANTKLGDWIGPNIFDEANSVSVTMTSGQLVTLPELTVLNGGNLAVLQSGDGWEVLQFKRAILTAANTYTLTGFLRGRQGSDWSMRGHAIGDQFVILNAALLNLDYSGAQPRVPILVKIVPSGATLQNTQPIAITPEATAQIPYNPVLLGGGFEVNGDATLQWVRRTRQNGAWLDQVEVPLSETTEAYDVEIYDSGYTTVKRTFSNVPVPTVTYTVAQQTTDFGAPQTAIHFKVYQRSGTVGRGYGAQGSIAPTRVIATLPSAPNPVIKGYS